MTHCRSYTIDFPHRILLPLVHFRRKVFFWHRLGHTVPYRGTAERKKRKWKWNLRSFDSHFSGLSSSITASGKGREKTKHLPRSLFSLNEDQEFLKWRHMRLVWCDSLPSAWKTPLALTFRTPGSIKDNVRALLWYQYLFQLVYSFSVMTYNWLIDTSATDVLLHSCGAVRRRIGEYQRELARNLMNEDRPCATWRRRAQLLIVYLLDVRYCFSSYWSSAGLSSRVTFGRSAMTHDRRWADSSLPNCFVLYLYLKTTNEDWTFFSCQQVPRHHRAEEKGVVYGISRWWLLISWCGILSFYFV